MLFLVCATLPSDSVSCVAVFPHKIRCYTMHGKPGYSTFTSRLCEIEGDSISAISGQIWHYKDFTGPILT
jgi:hypothetical protein